MHPGGKGRGGGGGGVVHQGMKHSLITAAVFDANRQQISSNAWRMFFPLSILLAIFSIFSSFALFFPNSGCQQN